MEGSSYSPDYERFLCSLPDAAMVGMVGSGDTTSTAFHLALRAGWSVQQILAVVLPALPAGGVGLAVVKMRGLAAQVAPAGGRAAPVGQVARWRQAPVEHLDAARARERMDVVRSSVSRSPVRADQAMRELIEAQIARLDRETPPSEDFT